MGPELFASQSAGASGMLMTSWVPSAAPPLVGVGMDPFHLSAAKEAPGSILATAEASGGVLVTMLGQAHAPLRGRQAASAASFTAGSE